MDQPLISVIVPVYNVECYIDQCIQSILNQTYQNLEIILIDDGSTDNCPIICDKYSEEDTRIRVIHKSNGGLSDARNAGLKICSGEFVAFVDSDDWIELDAYQEMMSFMLSDNLDIVFCSVMEIVDGKKSGIRYQYYPNETVFDAKVVQKLVLKDEIAAAVWMRLCRRWCYDNVLFPVGRNYEDIAVTFLPFEQANKVGFIDKPLYNYRINKKGIAHSKKPLSRYQMFLSYYDCFKYAEKNVPEVKEDVCVLASRFAIGAYLDYHCFGYEELEVFMPVVDEFMKEYKHDLVNSTRLHGKHKMALFLYYNCKVGLKIIYRIAIPFLIRGWS